MDTNFKRDSVFKDIISVNKRIFSGALLAAGFSLFVAGCNNGSTPGTGDTTASPSDTVATVGGTTVTRDDMYKVLEAQSGSEALTYLVDARLLAEELKSKGLAVTDAEVDADLQRREDNDPSIKPMVDIGGPRVGLVKDQIRRDLTFQKLMTKDTKATDAQVTSFFNKYKAYYTPEVKVKLGLLLTSTKVRADAMARALTSKSKTFEAMVAEQQKVDDRVGKASIADTGQLVAPGNYQFPAPITTALNKASKDTISSVFPIQPAGPFVIFKIVDKQGGVAPDLTKMRPVVEMDYKLTQIALKTVKANPTNPPFDKVLEILSTQLQQPTQQGAPARPKPTMRDILSSILSTDSQNILTTLRSGGTVQIDDPIYKDLAKTYLPTNPTPAPGATAGAATTPAAGSTPAATPAA